jgi:6-phosphogluconolactonase (cycloisomerase 2 family)
MTIRRHLFTVTILTLLAFQASLVDAVLRTAAAIQSGDPGPKASVGSFVYTITNPDGPNEIAAYERNIETGELVFVDTYPTGGRGSGRVVDSQSPLLLDAEGMLLFAVNPGSHDISVMAIRENGALERVGEPVPSRGIGPSSLALRNNLLYVANKGDDLNAPNYSGFFVGGDGSLSRVKRRVGLSIGDDPTQVLFNRDGSLLIGIRFGSGGLDCFAVKSNGKLKRRSSVNNERGPFAGLFDPTADERLLVADARVPGAASYLVRNDGSLFRVSLVSNAPERAACWIAVHSGGNRMWVSNTGTNTISLYTIDGDGRVVLSGTHNTVAFGRTPFELALDPDNRFLYQLNVRVGAQSIHTLRVTDAAQDAGVADVGAVGLPAGSSPIGLAVLNR